MYYKMILYRPEICFEGLPSSTFKSFPFQTEVEKLAQALALLAWLANSVVIIADFEYLSVSNISISRLNLPLRILPRFLNVSLVVSRCC